MEPPGLRQYATNALRYWEPRRLLYNAALAAIVLTHFFLDYPRSKSFPIANGVLVVFVLAVLANVAYCAVYLVDIFAQHSGFQALWFKYRWILLVIGILFAGTITHFFAMGMFFPG
jgi:hypothetical protein